MNFDTDDLMSKIYELLTVEFTKKAMDNFVEIFKKEPTKNDGETIQEFVQDRITDTMSQIDTIVIDSLGDLEFDIEDIKELEEFHNELDIEDYLDQRVNTFGVSVEKKIEPKIEEESELDWNEAE
jgi:hypothetical protein